jgi:hypothetical protein
MTLPGFAAEAALYRSDQLYLGARVAAISDAGRVTALSQLPGNTPCANFCNFSFAFQGDACTCALSMCGNFNNSLNCCADYFNHCQGGFEGPGGMGGGGGAPPGRPGPVPKS